MLLPSALLLYGLVPFAPLPLQEGDDATAPTTDTQLDLDADVGVWDSSFTSFRLSDDFEAGALIRTYWIYADGDIGRDLNGFDFHDVDIWAEMEIDDFQFRVNFDAATGDAVLEDAYARWVRSESFAVSVGNFKPRSLFSAAVDDDRLVFNDRTVLGTFLDMWDLGAQVNGRVIEKLDYVVSVTNGSNGADDDSLLVARAEYAFYGEDIWLQEGNRDVEDREFKLGGTYYSDTGDDAIGIGVDALAHWERFGGHAEVFMLDDGLSGSADLPGINVPLNSDSMPFSITGWFEIDENFQAALRYQSSDNSQDIVLYGVALSFYPTDGPVSFTADANYYVDDVDDSGVAVQIGVNMGRWRPER